MWREFLNKTNERSKNIIYHFFVLTNNYCLIHNKSWNLINIKNRYIHIKREKS